jgi:membrane protein YdbS with pleckstrin-like domain
MYNVFRTFCERLLRIPPDPHTPPGDEASTQIYRAAANYYKYRLVVWALASFAHILTPLIIIVALLITAMVRKDESFIWAAVLVPFLALSILAALFHLAVIRLDYEKRWYIVTDRSLRVREGVVGVREMTVTFANIQNISIEQGPVQRLLSIADLRVDTAGGGGGNTAHHQHGTNLHTAWFRGIDNASQVRELIQQRLRQWKDAGLGDHDDVTHAAHGATMAPTTPDFLEALREVHTEAQSLRRAIS